MINMDAPLREFSCISLQNIFDMDNLVDAYHNILRDKSLASIYNGVFHRRSLKH